jgi:AbrB family looped-hinge helix DNA binding protein
MKVQKELDTKHIVTLTLDSKSRGTIPKHIRDRLGIEPGDSIEVAVLEETND